MAEDFSLQVEPWEKSVEQRRADIRELRAQVSQLQNGHEATQTDSSDTMIPDISCDRFSAIENWRLDVTQAFESGRSCIELCSLQNGLQNFPKTLYLPSTLKASLISPSDLSSSIRCDIDIALSIKIHIDSSISSPAALSNCLCHGFLELVVLRHTGITASMACTQIAFVFVLKAFVLGDKQRRIPWLMLKQYMRWKVDVFEGIILCLP